MKYWISESERMEKSMSEEKTNEFSLDNIKKNDTEKVTSYKGTEKDELLSDDKWSMADIDKLIFENTASDDIDDSIVYSPNKEIFSEFYEEEKEPVLIQTPESNSEVEAESFNDEKTKIIDAKAVCENCDKQDAPNDMVYEKPGLIIQKKIEIGEKSEDLESCPVLIPVQELNNDLKNNSDPDNNENAIEGQIVINGFDDEDEPIKISEANVEEELKKRRAEKVSEFTKIPDVTEKSEKTKVLPEIQEKEKQLFSKLKKYTEHETNKRRSIVEWVKESFKNETVALPEPDENDEYLTATGKKKIRKEIVNEVEYNNRKLFILIISAVILFIVAGIATSVRSSVVTEKITLVINLIIYCISLFIYRDEILSGIKAIGKKKVNFHTGVFLAVVASLIQSIVMIFVSEPENISLFTPVVVCIMVLDCIGKKSKLSTVKENYKLLNYGLTERTYTAQKLDDENVIDNLGRGMLQSDPDIRYGVKSKIVSKFCELSNDESIVDKYSTRIFPFALVASLFIAVLAWIISGSVQFFFASLSCALCVSVPVNAVFALNLPLHYANKKLNKAGAFISGYSAAQEISETNAVVIDSSALFLKNECNLHGMKNYDIMQIDDVILYSAAMMISADGPLSKVFKQVIMNREDLLPDVQALTYEDKLGISAWIYNQRIFMGNRAMMVNHNIDIPTDSEESKYTHDDRKVIYLAVAGKLAALFVVSYKPDMSLVKPLKILDTNGISILIRTTDSNITESLIADTFSIPITGIKILNSSSANVFKEYSGVQNNTALAGVVYNGDSKVFLRSLTHAVVLTISTGIMMTIQVIGVILGLFLTLILTCFLSPVMGPLQLLVYTLIWTAVTVAIPLIKKVD